MTILDKNTLQQLYVEKQLTIRAIADRLGVNPRKVHDALRHWRIPRRSNSTRTHRPMPNFPFDEATLRNHYHTLGQTIKQIAEHFHVSTWIVFSAMKHWDIPRRRSGPRPSWQRNDLG